MIKSKTILYCVWIVVRFTQSISNPVLQRLLIAIAKFVVKRRATAMNLLSSASIRGIMNTIGSIATVSCINWAFFGTIWLCVHALWISLAHTVIMLDIGTCCANVLSVVTSVEFADRHVEIAKRRITVVRTVAELKVERRRRTLAAQRLWLHAILRRIVTSSHDCYLLMSLRKPVDEHFVL